MKKLNKLLSLLLTVSMSLTKIMTTYGAAYVAPELPETGVIFKDTFDYDANNSATLTTQMKSGKWDNAYNLFPDKSDEEHGKVIYGTPNAAATGLYYSNSKAGFGIEHINSGVLRISASYMLPSGYAMPLFNEQDYGYYLSTEAKNGALDKTDEEYATLRRNYYYTVEIGSKQTSSPKLVFAKSARDMAKPNSWVEEPVDFIEMDFDKWYDVDMVIDYENLTVKYYVNGEYITEAGIDKARFATHMPVYSVGIGKTGNKGDDTEQRLYIDDFMVEMLGSSIRAEISGYGENYVDVKFSHPVSAEEVCGISAYLKNAGNGTELAASSAEKLENGNARIYFDEQLEQGTGYELVFDNEVAPVWEGEGVLPAGYSGFFTTGVQTRRTELLDYDFENNFDLSGAVNNGEIQLFDAENNTASYKLNDEENTLKHLSIKTKNGNSYLELKHNSAYHPQDNVQFNFLDGAEVTKGIIVTEFEYAKAYDDPIKNTSGTEFTGYNALAKPSRGYLGYVDKSVTAFTEDESGNVFANVPQEEGTTGSRRATYISKFIHTAADWNGGSWGWGLYRGDPNKLGSPAPEEWVTYKIITDCDEKFTHIKIEADLDNKSYKVYVNGTMCGEADFLPGGINDVIFSAFAMSASRYSEYVEEGSRFLIDNIKAYNLVSSLYVTDISLTDYKGNESAFSGIVSAGTNKMAVEFSADLPDGAYEGVSISDADVTDIYSDGKYIIIEFENCLSAGEEYTMTIDESVGLDKTFSVRFSADEGEIVYSNPTFEVNGSYITGELPGINVGDSVTAKAEVINTSGDMAECIMTVAAYKGGYMTAVYGTELTLMPEDDYKDYAVISLTADEGIKEAEEIKVFIINNGTKANPIVKPLVLE